MKEYDVAEQAFKNGYERAVRDMAHNTEKPTKKVEQVVVRTRPRASYELSVMLKKGYKVIMANPIGDELEYILEGVIEK